MRRAALILAGAVSAATLVTLAVPVSHYAVWNATASVPTGLYLIRGKASLHVGERVAIAPPPSLRRLLAERRYLPAGIPLLKRVAAVRGQRVTALGRGKSARGTGLLGRGRSAALRSRHRAFQRRVVIKARVVRHRGAAFRSAPLARHVAYLEREGVTRDGSDGQMFDTHSNEADGRAFAARCEADRHHFRFIVSPQDAGQMVDLRTFTRELMQDMARDLETKLDWVAVDHWNTGNPHIHVLVRGVTDGGKDLVIDRGYISAGLRARAEERVTIELGPRSERDIRHALRREIDAERWTSLDRRLHLRRDARGTVDLRSEPSAGGRKDRIFLIGRARVLQRMRDRFFLRAACRVSI